MQNQYIFNISLSVLNHLGRNLYRNVITVLGEAISNSWDADAHHVWITIDRENGSMMIKDDGYGMNRDDFQDKFLKIGYSKRKNDNFRSKLGRPFIGRKGIGKLALLSCAQRIDIITKAKNDVVTGGTIDNSLLDKAITDDLKSQEYVLNELNLEKLQLLEKEEQGTVIFFDKVNDGIFNSVDYIKKAIALYFRFSLVDDSFKIYVNNEHIDESQLDDLIASTQFLWKINDIQDPIINKFNLDREASDIQSDLSIKGFIASVRKPSDMKIRGTQEKNTIDLFVNGRLREKDILRHIPTARIVENYVYGQIHYDNLDDGLTKDIFTSSREGIISDDESFKKFISEFETIFKKIIEDWDKYRRAKGDDGDPDNDSIDPKQRKSEELFNMMIIEAKSGSKSNKNSALVNKWVQEIREESKFNIPSYVDCFISENLLRKYIERNKLSLSQEAIKEATKRKASEVESKRKACISYPIRVSNKDIYYLDMSFLSSFIDKGQNNVPNLVDMAKRYKPVRDAVGHTSIITTTAKKQLSVELENIKYRVMELLEQQGNTGQK